MNQKTWKDSADFTEDTVTAWINNNVQTRHQGAYDGSLFDADHYPALPGAAYDKNGWQQRLDGNVQQAFNLLAGILFYQACQQPN